MGLCRAADRPQPDPVYGEYRPLSVGGLRALNGMSDRPHRSRGSANPPRLWRAELLAAEASGELNVGRPAELADRLDPFQAVASVDQRLRVAREGRGVAAYVGDSAHRGGREPSDLFGRPGARRIEDNALK